MKKTGLVFLAVFAVLPGWTATNNSGNAPTFLVLDIATNALVDPPVLSPDTVDVGVDLNADRTVDRWLSGERTEWLRRDAKDAVDWNSWRRYLIRLDADAGKTAKIRIVDNSSNYYIAVKSIILNNADGVNVLNRVPNGEFEGTPALTGWTLLEGSITDKAQLIKQDTGGQQVYYGSRYFTTQVNGNQDTATVESDSFVLEQPTSFVYGMVAGGVSELWNVPNYGTFPTDNLSYVYLDLGIATQDPNGQYDEGSDIPLLRFSPINREGSATGNNMHPVFLNTSGHEGKRAQVVAVDDSEFWQVQLDAWRMNWDPNHITNGGFEDVPEELMLNPPSPIPYTDHPDGEIPGWTVTLHPLPDGTPATEGATVYYYGQINENWADHMYIGTHSDGTDAFLRGIEIRSDVFVIQPILNPSQSVFLQYAGAQGTNRKHGLDSRSSIELQVNLNNNEEFGDDGDYIYREMSQGMGWNLNTSNLDLWQYPEYRFYILPEHYGQPARIYIEDTLTSGYGWFAVDDFYFWNGSEVVQPFPNADFEMGRATDGVTIPDWTQEIFSGFSGEEDWLAATDEIVNGDNPPTTNRIHGGRFTYVDGDFAADSSGDAGTGTLISVPFTIPNLVTTPVQEWSLYE